MLQISKILCFLQSSCLLCRKWKHNQLFMGYYVAARLPGRWHLQIKKKCFMKQRILSQGLHNCSLMHTTQNSWNKWTKISSLEINLFQLKNDGEKWSRIYFEIDRAPSEIPAKLPSQFGHSGQIFLHWAAATLKGLGQFQNKYQTTFYHHF